MQQPLKVLLLEDDPNDAQLVLRELQRAGFSPDSRRVDTEEDFLKYLDSDIEIVLSDYQMPQFDALRALELLRDRFADLEVPFLIISGTIGEETAVEAMKRGAVDYLLKDRLGRLGPAVQHALEQGRLARDRKIVKDALRLREEALGEVSQGVVISDESRRVIYTNASFTKITGYDRAEILGRNCTFLQGPETDPEVPVRIRAALNAGEAFEGEILNYRKDRSTFWNELSISPIRKDGGPIRFIGILRDVTERKAAQEALRRSEEHLRHERALLRALIDGISDMIFFKDENSTFLGCNKAFEKSMNVREADLIGRNDFDLVSRDVAEAFRKDDREMLETGRPQRIEEWIPFKDGGGGYFETLKTPYYGARGESLGLIGVSRDVTERKRHEEKLRAALERIKLATGAARAGIWELDLRTNDVTWDEQMFEIFGIAPGSAHGGMERWFRYMHPDDIAAGQKIIDEARIAARKSFDLEFRIYRGDNRELRYVRAVGMVKCDLDGAAVKMIGINHDVTEARLREQELSKALAQEKELTRKALAGEHAKGEFLAMMSHEIRTPMNGILGFAELLNQVEGAPPLCKDYARTISTSGEALLRILDDILDFSRLEEGYLHIEKQVFAPKALIKDIEILLGPRAREKDLEFSVTVGDDVPVEFVGDAGRLRQVLLNLVGNAIKFTSHGRVALSLSRAPVGGAASHPLYDFTVTDTGPGIAADKLRVIFQPFAQGDASISRRYGGTGLGLTISKRLAELLGGNLNVESIEKRGSIFRLRVPLELAGAARQETQLALELPAFDETFARKYPLRLLLVEDDKVNLKLIRTVTRRLGYEALTAENGREAVDIAEREHPDCVLMDLQMPEMDGIEATEVIRAKERISGAGQAFVAALTANILPADRERCMAAGMNGYLNKPLKVASLAEVLIEAYELRHSVP